MDITLLEEELPPPSSSFGKIENFVVEMRDGIMLDTNVYFPKGTSVWPVILIRSPYTLNLLARSINKAFTRYGYVVVAQSCRGTGKSGGKWEPFVNEREDGIDTIQWIIRQKWMNGNIGLFGHSYLSYAQWIIADRLPAEVKTLFISGFGTERYRQMYMGGMFRHEIYTSWAIENCRINGKNNKGELYKKAIGARPHIDMDNELLGKELSWYRDWVSNTAYDTEFWKKGIWSELQEVPGKIDIPICMIAGWYDHHIDGMVLAYEKLKDKIKKESRFVIGPWAHSLQPEGDLDYPNSQVIGVKAVNAALEWFDYQLKGNNLNKPIGVVETYIIGNGEWKTWQNWPPKARTIRFYLGKTWECKTMGCLLSENQVPDERSVLSYKYNPDNPVQTKGGSALLAWMSAKIGGASPGSLLQPEPGLREDILTFISEPLDEDLLIVSSINVNLSVASDAKDTAFSVKLMEVFPDGKAYNICDGITSLAYRNGSLSPMEYTPDEIVDISVKLWPITWCIKKGSSIRLDVSSSNFPAYHVHSNIEGPWAMQKDVKIACQKIYIGKGYNSFVELPCES